MSYPSDVFYLGEIHLSRQGTGFSPRGRRRTTRTFKVWTSNPYYGPNEICSCRGLPYPYAPYITSDNQSSDLSMVVTNMDAALIEEQKDDSRYIWLVTVEYSNDVPDEGIPSYTGMGNDPNSSSVYPWLEPPVIKFESETVNIAPQRDLSGRPYVNSAQMPFTPSPTKPRGRVVMVITRNEPTFDVLTAANYAYALNNDVFMGALPGTVQCLPIHGEQLSRGSITYYRNTYKLRFGAPLGPNELNPLLATLAPVLSPLGLAFLSNTILNLESLQPYYLDAGLMELKTTPPYTTPVPVPIIMPGTAFPVSQPVLLNGNGQKQLPNAGRDTTPVWLYFNDFQLWPFNPILTTGIFSY